MSCGVDDTSWVILMVSVVYLMGRGLYGYEAVVVIVRPVYGVEGGS